MFQNSFIPEERGFPQLPMELVSAIFEEAATTSESFPRTLMLINRSIRRIFGYKHYFRVLTFHTDEQYRHFRNHQLPMWSDEYDEYRRERNNDCHGHIPLKHRQKKNFDHSPTTPSHIKYFIQSVWFSDSCPDYNILNFVNMFFRCDEDLQVKELALSHSHFVRLFAQQEDPDLTVSFLKDCRFRITLHDLPVEEELYIKNEFTLLDPSCITHLVANWAPHKPTHSFWVPENYSNLTHIAVTLPLDAVGFPDLARTLSMPHLVAFVYLWDPSELVKRVIDVPDVSLSGKRVIWYHMLQDRRVFMLRCDSGLHQQWWDASRLGIDIWDRAAQYTSDAGRKLLSELKFEIKLQYDPFGHIMEELITWFTNESSLRDVPISNNDEETPALLVKQIWFGKHPYLERIPRFPEMFTHLPNVTDLSLSEHRFLQLFDQRRHTGRLVYPSCASQKKQLAISLSDDILGEGWPYSRSEMMAGITHLCFTEGIPTACQMINWEAFPSLTHIAFPVSIQSIYSDTEDIEHIMTRVTKLQTIILILTLDDFTKQKARTLEWVSESSVDNRSFFHIFTVKDTPAIIPADLWAKSIDVVTWSRPSISDDALRTSNTC